MDDRMRRVSAGRPCPICGKPDWCLVVPDGSAALCQRIKDGSVKKCGDAGYLHILDDRHNRHDGHKGGARPRHTLTVAHEQRGQMRDFEQTCVRYQSQLADEKLHVLARSLGVSRESLRRLRVGWDGQAHTFPMCDVCGTVIGIRRRFPSGRKASTKGSRTGLFIPTGLSGKDPLLICEGPSDTAAALDLGFDAIGRPNCSSLVKVTAQAVRGRDEIVVIADNDVVGRTGAGRLAAALAMHCRCVRVVTPPDGVKDLRQWVIGGLTRHTLREIVSATPAVRLAVRFLCVDPAERRRR